jgi:ABC-type lipoprotein export system ATPase subunit
MIEARRVTYAYPVGPTVIDDLTARFAERALTAVTGASGVGKSTLLYVIGLMLRPRSGRILIGGRDVAAMSDAERSALRSERIGFVFQDAALDTTRSVVDNVLEGAVYAGRSRRHLRPRALDLLERYEVGVDAGRRAHRLSGGQAQRVALCRALLREPDIVLADEPTGNLDAANAALVLQGLRDAAARGAAVLVATHDAAVVERCDTVLAL